MRSVGGVRSLHQFYSQTMCHLQCSMTLRQNASWIALSGSTISVHGNLTVHRIFGLCRVSACFDSHNGPPQIPPRAKAGLLDGCGRGCRGPKHTLCSDTTQFLPSRRPPKSSVVPTKSISAKRFQNPQDWSSCIWAQTALSHASAA